MIKKILSIPIRMVKCYLFYSTNFSKSLGLLNVMLMLCARYPNSSITKWAFNKKHNAIINYLDNKYGYTLNNSFKSHHELLDNKKYPIWQCWWQGAEGLEGITKICTNSVIKNSNGHKVILVTRENFKDYVKIPEFILDKVDKGIISFTCFSDYLRMKLIEQNGGMWIDSTALLTQSLDESWFELPFFSTKEKAKNNFYASMYRWSSWCVGGEKDSIVASFFCNLFEEYWKQENCLIDYYLVDYILCFGYRVSPQIREIIDRIPYSNAQKHKMQPLLNRVFDEKIFNSIISDTCIFKLSRKTEYRDEVNGKETLYKYLKTKYHS